MLLLHSLKNLSPQPGVEPGFNPPWTEVLKNKIMKHK